MPRVITGKYRGAVLFAPKGDNTRPTTDKVKEALFSMIQMRVPDSRVLDLYSGTGQIGIESVSRGAESAVMVDKAGSAISVIKRNLEKIRAEKDPSFTVIKGSAAMALEKMAAEGRQFDIIFMDPPYRFAQQAAIEAADLIVKHNLLAEDGIFIVEHSSEEPFVTDVINLKLNRSCSYGLTMLTFFE
ncbi:MAG: 16S rRNA (guanine(966)-N(2))-methyltransferase RsmD [Saccharofermentans sp.]|nr:16S rRNA (guanine(966)-N(2))-methyltransferase RsmD [Saccharofermentans sp.]